MQNVQLNALIPFKVSLPMIKGIGAFFPCKFPLFPTNTLKLEELNNQMGFFIWRRPHWMTKTDVTLP